MKKLISIIFLFITVSVSAQYKPLLYNFDEIPQAQNLNPGLKHDFNWFVGVPALSQVDITVGTSGPNLYDVLGENDISFNDKIHAIAHNFSHKEEFFINEKLELLSLGFRGKNKNNFYTAGFYQEIDAITYLPKDLIILGLEGNADYIGKRFDLSHFKGNLDILTVLHFGLQKKINESLSLGGRVKLYNSIVNMRATSSKGYFSTTTGERNDYTHHYNGKLELKTSNFFYLKDELFGDEPNSSALTKAALFGGSLGLGLDLGVTYEWNDQWRFTGSLIDFGFIHQNKNIENYTLEGNYRTEGLEVVLPVDQSEELWQNLLDEIEEEVPLDTLRNNYVNTRPLKLYTALNYNFGQHIKDKDCDCEIGASTRRNPKYQNSVGAQLFLTKRPLGPKAAMSVYYVRRFGRWLNFKTTYTVNKYSFTNVGFGLGIKAANVQLYALADNVFAYSNLAKSQYAAFQFGINILSSN